MQCPACNQEASSFLRSAISLEGASYAESFKGYLRCQHCGTLLRTSRFRKEVGYVVLALAIAFFTFWFVFLKGLIANIGIKATLVTWIVFVLLWVLFFILGLWKYRVLEKVEEEKKPVEKAKA